MTQRNTADNPVLSGYCLSTVSQAEWTLLGVALFNFEREFSAESNLVVSQAAKQSCEQQQRDVYESHRHRTFSLAFYMTGNEMEAEEILATTFVRAFQQSQQPDGFAVDSALVSELSQRFPLKRKRPRRLFLRVSA